MRKLLLRLFLLKCLSCTVYFAAFCQLPNYTISRFPGIFTPLDTTAITSPVLTGDNNEHPGVSIGFDFTYCDSVYKTVSISTNGYMCLGNPAVSQASATYSTNNSYLFVFGATYAPTAVIAPYWDDLTAAAVGSNPAGSVQFQTRGTAPNRTFTVQWNVSSYNGVGNGQPAMISFQAILFETSNRIEFHYKNLPGPSANVTESASIGLNGRYGPNTPGAYLDAVTGSRYVFNAYYTGTRSWPKKFYRFTPGAPTPLAGGTYTVGESGVYQTLSDAVFDLNHKGISGPVTLKLTDKTYSEAPGPLANVFPIIFGPITGTTAANTITVEPDSGRAELQFGGHNSYTTGVGGVSLNNTYQTLLGVFGADFLRINNLDLRSTTDWVGHGIYVSNASVTNGAQNNIFKNITIRLDRNSVGSKGIMQQRHFTASAASGANSYNKYYNIKISHAMGGIHLLGNSTYPDRYSEIAGIDGDSTVIGSDLTDDIGGNTQAYGIRVVANAYFRIYNCVIRNVTGTNTNFTYGVSLESDSGICEFMNNKIYNIRNLSNNNFPRVYGLFVSAVSGGENRIYNNFISGITIPYTGGQNATRQVFGIAMNSITGAIHNIDFNTVVIDNSVGPSASSTCLGMDNSTGTASLVRVRNNIFANYTGAQTGAAKHYAWDAPGTTAIGAASSVSNYNVLYIDNAANGFVGRSNATDRATVSDWRTNMGQDMNSLNIAPGFIDPVRNFHIDGPSVNDLGTPVAWVTQDIDGQPRGAMPDIGADEYSNRAVDLGITGIVSPVPVGCYGSLEEVQAVITNFDSLPADLLDANVRVVVKVSGAASAMLIRTLQNNNLNGGVPLAPGASLTVPVGILNMSSSGDHIFTAYTITYEDTNQVNDTLVLTLGADPGVISTASTNVCQGDSALLTVAGNNRPVQWQQYNAATNTWSNVPGSNTTDSILVVKPIANTSYRVVACDGKVASNMLLLRVRPYPPKPVISAGGPLTFCQGDSVMLTSSSSTGNLWFPGNEKTPVLAAKTSGQYVLTVTTPYGCSAASDTITLNARPRTPPVVTAGGPLVFCPGETVVLTSSLADGNIWSTGETMQSITVGAPGNYTVTDASGCGGSSGLVAVTHLPAPPVPVISTGGPLSFCKGDSVLLTSSQDTGNVWLPGNRPGKTIAVSESGTYTVSIADTACVSVSDPVTVVVHDPQAPEITVEGQVEFCSNESAILHSSVTEGITWSPGGQTTPSIVVSQGGTYVATYKDEFGCTAASAGVAITVHPVPQVTMAPLGRVCLSDPPFELTGGQPHGGVYGGTGVQGSQFFPSIAGAGVHTISYSYTDANGCSSMASDNILVANCTGISALPGVNGLSLMPNPGKGMFTLSLPVALAGPVHIEVADVHGRIVYNREHGSQSAVQLDLSHCAPAIYHVLVRTLSGEQQLKLVLEP